MWHFHDPLKSWDTAGLDLGLLPFESSVRWMQDPDQAGLLTGGSWSWRDARRLQYEALTESDPVQREVLWADLFRALGQLMHLVADASVPEHARNDPHVLGALKLGNSYETWVSSQHEGGTPREAQFVARFLSAPIGFFPDILAIRPPTGETLATVPVARLIDADRYDGTNPNATVDAADPRAPTGVGLAEIANANFFSEDTLRGQYPSPINAGLIPVNLVTPLGRVRRYFSRPAGQGLLPANPLRAECAADAFHLRGDIVQPPPYPCVDAVVWNQVAAHMLPRAVGYARGVLDYFFRGSIAVTNVKWDGGGVRIRVQNTGDEEMDGAFEVYARHNPGTAGERRVKLTTLGSGERVRLEPGDAWVVPIAVPTSAVPTSSHVLIFKGRLGLEEDAVIGQVFTVPHVEVRQTIYQADVMPVCSRQPTRTTQPPYNPGSTLSIRSDSMRCEWHLINHRAAGTLVTNTPIDPVTSRAEPVIERIEALWAAGLSPGPAPLVLDGAPVSGAWQRLGTEPDPTTFEIVDPTARSRSSLYLMVSYKNGGAIQAQIATFSTAISTHGKSQWLDYTTPATPRYLVTSARGVGATVAYNSEVTSQMNYPLFEPVTIGGQPVPTDTRVPRSFGGVNLTAGLSVSASNYNDNVNDHFEIFTDREAADALYAAIEPLQGPHPQGPFFPWVAEVRRAYQPREREFLRAFVTATPEPYSIQLAARDATRE
ncbi:MAG: hypothetical protein ACRD3C_06605 [Vicinamibacterales bacterium]